MHPVFLLSFPETQNLQWPDPRILSRERYDAHTAAGLFEIRTRFPFKPDTPHTQNFACQAQRLYKDRYLSLKSLLFACP